jgi:hypothetical protein
MLRFLSEVGPKSHFQNAILSPYFTNRMQVRKVSDKSEIENISVERLIEIIQEELEE